MNHNVPYTHVRKPIPAPTTMPDPSAIHIPRPIVRLSRHDHCTSRSRGRVITRASITPIQAIHPCTKDMGKIRACPKPRRSEEHTSELQSLRHLVCRLLLEKKKKE